MRVAADSEPEPLLEARGIVKTFGGVAAIQGLDLTIRRGEVVGVIGPNGAGKTTLVNCISGLDKPTSGSIFFRGRDVTRAPVHEIGRLGIARTFQVVKPLKQLTARDNVAVGAMFGAGGAGRSTRDARRRADEVLQLVGLGRLAERHASELTLSELKRLELAKALAMEPELLLLDEVMAGLKPAEIELAMELVGAIHRSGITLLVIEHVMKAILGVSDRVIVLHHGKKLAEGGPREVTEDRHVIEAYLGERFAKRARREREAPPERVSDAAPRTVEPAGALEASPAPRPARPLLEVAGLCSGYGDVQVLWDVTLEVREGELVSLIGANGSGKTTLLWTLSQLIRPWSGTIRMDGRDLTSARSSKVVEAGLVQVPQGRRVFAGLSVEDNLLQGAHPRRDAAEVRRTLEWVLTVFPQLAERLRQPAGLLSGGEQQMCAIGRALMSRPRLLVVDELSLGLAPRAVGDLLELLSRIHEEGMTVLLVDQDVQVALERAHRGYVLASGRIAQAGSVSQLLGDAKIRKTYLGL